MSSNPPGQGTPFASFVDKLTIETPEQTALEFSVAGIGSRFLALAVDTLIQMCVGLVVGIGGSLAIGGISAVMPKAAIWGFAVLVMFFFFLYFGYFALFEILWNGQTPGKRKAGIRVMKDSGRPLTPAESIGRNLMRIVDWLPGFYAVGIVSTLLTKGNKRLGDLVVGSLVVHESPFKELKPVWQAPQAPAAVTQSLLGANRLSPEECALIDTFLNRRLDLEPAVRFQMADQIFRRLASKITLPPENKLSAEAVLEALAHERRATGHYG